MHDNCILKHELPRYAKIILNILATNTKIMKLEDSLGYNKQMQKYFEHLICIFINIKKKLKICNYVIS